MNPAQKAKIVALSNYFDDICIDGKMSFTAEQCKDGAILFSATNIHSDLLWFEATKDFYGFVGKRGGVTQYAGNLKSPKFLKNN